MSFDPSQKENFIEALMYGLPPFDRFVAKGDIIETEKEFPSRIRILKKITNTLNNSYQSVLIPIIGTTGSGKTHFLHNIKNHFDIEAFTSFIALPRSKLKFFYYIYSDLIEEFGAENLKEFSQEFGEMFGADEKLYGLFRTKNNFKVMMNAFNALKEEFLHTNELEQCISVLVSHLMSPEVYKLAERWLLGQLMDFEDLFTLNADLDLSNENMATTMLKILIENYSKGILFLFDDFDKAKEEFDGIIDDYDDSNWANDIECEEDDINCDDNGNLLDFIIRFLENTKNFKIVISLDESNEKNILNELKAKIKNQDSISDPINLYAITLSDTFELYFERLSEFAEKNKIYHPATEFDTRNHLLWHDKVEEYGNDAFFPLTRHIVEQIHQVSQGNVRIILKNFKKIFDAIIFEEITPNELVTNGYNNYITQ
jgi:hypothetical protein